MTARGEGVTLHAAWSPGEVRVAARAGDTVIDYALWRQGTPDGVGDVHRARVVALVPAMAGAFVALEGAEGFLPDSEGAKDLTAGTLLGVRVTRGAQGGKGPRVSAREVEDTEGPVRLIRRGIDPLRDYAARYPAAPLLVDDAALAASCRADLGERLTRVPRAFDDAIETEVESLSATVVSLASGVRLSFHPTPALVAIDADGGSALTRRGMERGVEAGGASRRHKVLNETLVPELARQIRLRNLSGAILVDFAGMKAKQRGVLAPALNAALSADPLRPRFLGFTALGLAEIARPRIRPPLHELLEGPLAAGLAALRALARAAQADPGRSLSLRAAPAVVAALAADPVALKDLARITGRVLTPRSDPSLPADGWRIESAHGQTSSPLPHL